jgi:hypothetical protein
MEPGSSLPLSKSQPLNTNRILVNPNHIFTGIYYFYKISSNMESSTFLRYNYYEQMKVKGRFGETCRLRTEA